MTKVVCEVPETYCNPPMGTVAVSVKDCVTPPAVTLILTSPVVFPRVTTAEARPTWSVVLITLLKVAVPAAGTDQVTGV